MRRMALLLMLGLISAVLLAGCVGTDTEQMPDGPTETVSCTAQTPTSSGQGETLPPGEIVIGGTQAPTEKPTEAPVSQAPTETGFPDPTEAPTGAATETPTEAPATLPTEQSTTMAPTEPDDGYFPWYG